MVTRRQEKVARIVREAVSDAIMNHLSDPRIEGFTTVTRVDLSVDLKSADVSLSIFGSDEKSQNRTFEAIEHARSRIQSHLAHSLKSKFCPSLRFHRDEHFKKAIETIDLIKRLADEREDGEQTEPMQ